MTGVRAFDGAETRISHGLEKRVEGIGLRPGYRVTLEAVECHGRVALTRSENGRHRVTDQLEPDEAEHFARCLTEQAQRARALRRRRA